MAVLTCNIRSKALDNDTGLTVILPQDRRDCELPPKLIYLLHGIGGNSATWLDRTTIYSLSIKYNAAIVLPEIGRSFCFDMEYGPNYYTYISEELPQLCKKLFALDTSPENSFIAGLSMGGYSALKVAFANPDKYAGCAGFSSSADIKAVVRDQPMELEPYIIGILGQEMTVPDEADLFYLAQKYKENSDNILSKIMLTCGTEDFLYQHNIDFHNALNNLEIPHEYHEWSGSHTWDFWEKSTKMAFEYLFGDGK
ncbi:MAG: hypothetical protein GX967_03975 [Clostridiales bacterium]|nr:hypothetical protein [Clostridiales bacterium]